MARMTSWGKSPPSPAGVPRVTSLDPVGVVLAAGLTPRKPYSTSLPCRSASIARRERESIGEGVAGLGVEAAGVGGVGGQADELPLQIHHGAAAHPEVQLAVELEERGVIPQLPLVVVGQLGAEGGSSSLPGDVGEDPPARRGPAILARR